MRFGLLLGVGLFGLSLWFGWFNPSPARVGSIRGESPRPNASGVAVMGDSDDDASFSEDEAEVARRLFQLQQAHRATEVLNGLEGDHHRRMVVRRTFFEIVNRFPEEADLKLPSEAVEHSASGETPVSASGTPPTSAPKQPVETQRAEFQKTLTTAVSFAEGLKDPKSRAIALSQLAKGRAQIDDPQFEPSTVKLATMAADNLKPAVIDQPSRWSVLFKQVFGSGMFATFVAMLGTQLVVGFGKFRDNLMEEIAKLTASAASAFVPGGRASPAKQEKPAAIVAPATTD